MTEFAIERFRYTWLGEWEPGTEYKRDDVVSLNGKSYVCLITHTASTNFLDDLNRILPGSEPPQPEPRWVLMTNAQTFRGTWETGSEYNVSELVYYKGSVFLCIAAHVATVFSQDRSNWTIFALHQEFVGDWTSGDDYADGSLLRYNGKVYRCKVAHTAQGVLEDDAEKWSLFFEGREFRGEWAGSTEFRHNDLVKFGSSIFRCTETHTSTSTFDTDKFAIEFPGFQFEGEWDPSSQYQQGDIVLYGGKLYYALRPNQDSDPFRLADDSTQDWEEFSASLNFRGEYSLGTEYKTGDVVQRGGQLFAAKQDVDRNEGEGSVLDYLDGEWWELLIPGSAWAEEWDAGKFYSVGDVVYFLGTAYRSNQEHFSDDTNFPGDNGNIFDYWDVLVQAGQPGGLQEEGDLLTYGLNRTVVGDTSSLGDTRVPINPEGGFLSVSEDLEIFWRERKNNSDVVYVSPTGIDDETFDFQRGLVPDKPFKTVKHAAQYIEDNFEPLDLTTIRVSTGDFSEIAPIIVPAGCAIVGDELRSTTIRANAPLPEYQNNFQYIQQALNHLTTFILSVLSNQSVTPSEGNTETQLLNTTTTDLNGINAIIPLIDDFTAFIDFRINGNGVEPVMSGSNDPNTNQNLIDAGQALWENREFIAAELTAFLKNTYAGQSFEDVKYKNDFYSLFRGIKRDLAFAGNYATLLAAERYVNAVLGSQDKNLFYVRDTTGIRQLTVRGLQGNLTGVTVDRPYQVATGGAYVALDPGWGPDDERTWIINRSPYIQGVTTLGTGCVGKRVDGTLHNGGNRSMVSNDFTQVLSDGVGVWVSDGGRTELVSVFSYYCAVGYLAEQGGVIRATNGNNSYGRFGTIADGNDPTEIPQTVTVFNRNNEAQVVDGFAGGDNNEVLIFEYSNAGEEYSQADATITGAGDFASVEYSDFRDGAVFEERVINTRGSGTPGGSGYLIRQGFAQVTFDATSSITLSATDNTILDSDYIGARIIIINGQGAGQYGYIAAYDPPRKDATIRRESDGELGWDHVIPGTPIESSLDSSAQYRIEPRVETTAPPFGVEQANLPNGRTVIDAEYGETTREFTGIQLGAGSITDPEFPSQPATLTVTRRGRAYEVSVIDPGAGYQAGDQFTIPATDLDGSSPENDLEITITEVTDDSTASIVSISTRGTGRKGRIVAIAQPNFVLYSDDGRTWQETTLPFVGNYRKIAAATNRFVAIAEAENRIAFSLDGENWEERSLPSTENWSDITYGQNKFVMISDNSDFVLYSADGETWSETQIPEDAVSDSTGDSTLSSYTHVAYGKGQFVAVSTSDRATATSPDGINWARNNEAILDRGSEYFYDFAGFAYGDNRFLAVSSDGVVIYSFDGVVWYEGATLPQTGSYSYKTLKYSQGVFLTIPENITTNDTDFVATTETGLMWSERQLGFTRALTSYGYATLNGRPEWFAFVNGSANNGVTIVQTGKQAKLRALVDQGSIETVKIWDPGSGYTSSNDLELTITDSQFTVAVETNTRVGNGVLAQPDFVNRGSGYQTSSSNVEITGDGFADIIPEDNQLTIAGVESIPGIGVQIRIDGILDDEGEDTKLFSGSRVTDLGDDGSGNGTNLVQLQISPDIENEDNLQHNTQVTLREEYSQARVTNHDFLDIGTGNFEQTNYPVIYAGGNFFVASPQNEAVEYNGGRVFFVSTDQDGNFRGGDLFAVDQATGVVTISAEFFDLEGLSELALGGIRLGGSGTVVREFSTDPNFTQDSDNIIPTQRAVSRFLAAKLSVGGESVETNKLQSGRVVVGTQDNIIDNIADEYVIVDADVNHLGADENGNPSGQSGTIVSQQLFLRNFNDSVQ